MIFTALRKAPQISAIGFRQSATKLLTVVDLLMGDIPERARFLQKNLEKSLQVSSRLKIYIQSRAGNFPGKNPKKVGKLSTPTEIIHTHPTCTDSKF